MGFQGAYEKNVLNATSSLNYFTFALLRFYTESAFKYYYRYLKMYHVVKSKR